MKTTSRFKKFIIVSLGLHFGLVAFTYLLPQLKNSASTSVEIIVLDEQQTLLETQTEKKFEQVVETDEKSANQLVDEKAKLLSAKNNVVEKQTQAQLGQTFKNSNQEQKPFTAPTQNLAQQKLASEKNVPEQKANLFKPSLFGEKFDAYSALNKKEQKKLAQQKNLKQPQSGALGSAATDKIEGLDTSLKTALNTREYKYYGYYQRIKTQLNQYWQPSVKNKVSRLLTQGRTIATEDSNKITKLIIVLNDEGTLVKVQVLSESGVRDLDEAAVEAFRQAAPFPNPPKGLIETDGTIKIRWDFVVES